MKVVLELVGAGFVACAGLSIVLTLRERKRWETEQRKRDYVEAIVNRKN